MPSRTKVGHPRASRSIDRLVVQSRRGESPHCPWLSPAALSSVPLGATPTPSVSSQANALPAQSFCAHCPSLPSSSSSSPRGGTVAEVLLGSTTPSPPSGSPAVPARAGRCGALPAGCWLPVLDGAVPSSSSSSLSTSCPCSSLRSSVRRWRTPAATLVSSSAPNGDSTTIIYLGYCNGIDLLLPTVR